MTFEELYSAITAHKQSDNRRWIAEAAWVARVPEGYVIAPIEPTKAMIDAFWGEVETEVDTRPSDLYKAMIQAAQESE